MSAGIDTVVVGGGANGLAAAARLGRRALLLEAGDALGGQSRSIEFAPGFHAAPLGIDPGWVPPRVARALGVSRLATVAVDTPVSVADGSGGFLTLPRGAAQAAEAIARHSRADAERWPAFTTRLHRLASFLGEIYQSPAPDVDVAGIGEALALLSLGRRFRGLGRADMIEFLRTLPLSAWELADDFFESPPLKAAIGASGVIDLQQGPRSGGTGFVLLHHLVGSPEGSIRGRVPWKDGPDAFTRAAEAAAKRRGATIRTGARVVRVLVQDDAVAGVVLEGGEEIAARRVISTADPARTVLEWIDPVWLDPELVRAVGNVRHRGCTAFVLYALDTLPEMSGLSPHALAGIVSLTPDLRSLERAADAAKYGTVSERPHVELHVPTILWPQLAPVGKHVLVARVQYAPYRLSNGETWDAARGEALEASVTAAIGAASPGFSARIGHRATWTPADLERRLGLVEGSPSQGELALDQILFMRPVAGLGRHRGPVAGLYFGGAGAHPGPGILGGSGWLAASRALSDR